MSRLQLRPHGSRLLIRKHEEEQIGRILVPHESQKVSTRGTVVEVGPECTKVDVGDDIFFGTYAPVLLPTKNSADLRELTKTDSRDFFIMNEDDIICFVEKSSKEEKKDAK